MVILSDKIGNDTFLLFRIYDTLIFDIFQSNTKRSGLAYFRLIVRLIQNREYDQMEKKFRTLVL